MIYVERGSTDDEGNAIKPNSAWFGIVKSATKKAKVEKGDHNAKRGIYANSGVTKALEQLFHDKCAYCECKMTATADWDVEHFRPKGRVAEREDHPGYYWLTYEWDNLYPSCKFCNQRRKDRPRWNDRMELPAQGKFDQFPLLDESTRAMKPSDDVYAEHTLLIDPCFDEPEDYLGYDPTGQIFSLSENPYGNKTIEVLGLKRRRLRDRRLDKIRIVTECVRRTGSNPGLRKALLDMFAGAESCHAGVARYVVKRPSEFGV